MPKKPKAAAAVLTVERLRAVLSYDAGTGLFRWKVTLSERAVAGSLAGCLHKTSGRVYVAVDRRLYLAHRLAWLYVYGYWPVSGIDHRDGDASNNALQNLRPATQALNSQNLRRAHRDNSTGFLGVTRSGKGYRGALSVSGMRVFCRTRSSASEAHADYLEVKRLFHPFATI